MRIYFDIIFVVLTVILFALNFHFALESKSSKSYTYAILGMTFAIAAIVLLLSTIQIKNKNNMATHQITIAKASKNDFEKVYNLLSPMEELFNNRWSNEESWTEWDDDNEDKLELLAIRKEIAEEEYCDEDEVDNRLVLYEFIKRRMRLCGCSNWQRVVTAAECLIDTFCDPQESCLAWRPDLKRAMYNTMRGE